jgi:hypothetical protein
MEQTPARKGNGFEISYLAVAVAGLTLVVFFALGYGAASAFHTDDAWQASSAGARPASASVEPRQQATQTVEYLPAVLAVKAAETEPLPPQF